MSAKLTRIHLGLGMGEIGVQFEIDDGAGGAVKQRAFVRVDDATLAPVWLAAQSALASKLAELPLDLPPGAVTTALMRKRDAEAAAEAARKDERDARDAERDARQAAEQAEAQRQATEGACACLEAELAKKVAEAAALDEQIATKRAAAEAQPAP